MAILVAFAFLAGIVTVLSPCILPVLPVVLSGSVGGGKARPRGIIAGFVLSFAAFTLTLSALVKALGIGAELLRWIAAGTILLFGLVMTLPFLKERFSSLAGPLGSRVASARPGQQAGQGLWGGFALGLGIGLVWTPCVGPIMASVISLALSSGVDFGGVLITLAYSLGTALPLYLVMKGGRGLLKRFSFLSTKADRIQRIFGVLMIATAVALFTGADRAFQTFILRVFPGYGAGLTAIEETSAVRAALDKRAAGLAPDAASPKAEDPLSLGSGVWINSPPLSLPALKGKVVLVDFWTYSCINCLRTIPYLRAWHEAYAGEGLVIVGVHSPEFTFEKSESNLRRAARELGVTWPVAQDNDFGIWNAYGNQYWPSHYLYGRDGVLIESHFGEGGYEETERLIRKALGFGKAEAGKSPAVSAIPPSLPMAAERTPETYLGFGRGERFSSPESPSTDRSAMYTLPPEGLAADRWAFDGTWIIGKDNSIGETGSSLQLRFKAARVYLVINPLPDGRGSAEARVTLDGAPVSGGDVKDGILRLDGDRLYTLLDGSRPREGLLRIELRGRAAVFAFTFG